MVEAIIFDHDGVMVDTEPLQSKAWIEMLKKYGKEPELYENGLVHIVGISIDENWKILKEKYNVEEEIDSLEEQRGEIYFNLLKEAQPIEGLMDLLKDLNKEKISKGIMLAIASSSNKEYIEAVVKKFGFEKMFDLIVTRKDVEKGKPNPDIYLKVANEFRVKPSDCVVLEDSQTGVEAGYHAGMKVIAIPNEYTLAHDFSKANKIISSLKEIDLNLINCLYD